MEETILTTPPKASKPKKPPLDAACDEHAPGDSKCTCVNNEIFKHDSGWATAGVGKRAKNPCNMRVPGSWTPKVGIAGVTVSKIGGEFARFSTLEDGISACVELYARFYQDATPEALVRSWTDGGGQGAYLRNVKSCYE